MSREKLAEYLGVGTYEDSCIYRKVYGDASPPRHPRIGGNNFPTVEKLGELFIVALSESDTGSRETRYLNLVAKVVHEALRRTLLPRHGHADKMSSLQQWLLIHIMDGEQFDIVDFLLCEIEDVITDGLACSRQQPYAHFISYIPSQINYPKYMEKYMTESLDFQPYNPAKPDDIRRGIRTVLDVRDFWPGVPDPENLKEKFIVMMQDVDATGRSTENIVDECEQCDNFVEEAGSELIQHDQDSHQMDRNVENFEKQSDHVEIHRRILLFGKEMIEKIPQQQPWHTNAILTDLGVLATAVDTSDCDVSSSREEVISVMPQSSSPTVGVTAPVDQGTATYLTRLLFDDPSKIPSEDELELWLSQPLAAS
ncbi:hypothetical protein EJB05_08356, partial [Eragrostis curvula]